MAILDSQQGAPAQTAMLELRRLREAINGNFSQMDQQADAVQFETGPTRNRNLRKRDRMLAVQPAIRTVFLREIALVQYLPGRPETECDRSPEHFQKAITPLLTTMSARVEGGHRFAGRCSRWRARHSSASKTSTRRKAGSKASSNAQ